MKKVIRYTNFFLISVFCFFSFNSCCRSNSNIHNILYYYRDEGGINGYMTYHDYLIVENYKDGIMSIKEFEEIGKKYIDTVKANKPVSGITFVGKSPCGKLPKGGWDNWMKQKKYFTISIGFDNVYERNKNNREIRTGYIGIFGKNKASYTTQPQIDSLLNLKTKLFTGF